MKNYLAEVANDFKVPKETFVEEKTKEALAIYNKLSSSDPVFQSL